MVRKYKILNTFYTSKKYSHVNKFFVILVEFVFNNEGI